MKRFNSWIKDNKYTLLLVIVTVTAFFVRSYNLENWVYLESDQARDLRIINKAFDNGPEDLPLLGPKASGSDLHLGPAFYYFQYTASLLFNSADPHVLVYPDLLFSILTIPLLYLFLRQFFDKKSSLLTVLVFASSYVLSQFARFAWNPNSIPFWILLGMLATLKTFTEKDREKAGWWLALLGFAYGIASQLHFILFLGFPVSVVLFWFFYRPREIYFRFWLLSLVSFLFINLPLFVNDLFRGGNNWVQFLNTLKEGKGDPRGFFESMERFLSYQAKYYTNFLTSLNKNEFEGTVLLGYFIIALFVFFTVYLLKKGSVFWIKNLSVQKKAFLVLAVVWFLSFMPLFYKLAFSMNRPRYWFVVFIFPFLALSFLLNFLFNQRGKKAEYSKYLAYVLVIVLLVLNFSATYKLYASLEKRAEVRFLNREWSSQTMKQRGLETAENQEEVARYMLKVTQENNKKGVCYKSPDILVSIYAFFVQRNDGNVFYKGDLSKEVMLENSSKCTFFFIHKKTKSTKEIAKRLPKELVLKNRHTIGVSAVWEVEIR